MMNINPLLNTNLSLEPPVTGFNTVPSPFFLTPAQLPLGSPPPILSGSSLSLNAVNSPTTLPSFVSLGSNNNNTLIMLLSSLMSLLTNLSNTLNNSSATSNPSLAGGSTLGNGAPDALKGFSKEINAASQASGIPANVLGAQIWQESRGNLAAVSSNPGNALTDMGLMQVNPNTFKALQDKYPQLQGVSLDTAAGNIMAGAFYMKDQMATFGSLPLALRAYNSGPGSVDKRDPNKTTTGLGDPTYVSKVMDFANRIQKGEQLPP
jgi:soluble lytic murein transglycosylase-like protein